MKSRLIRGSLAIAAAAAFDLIGTLHAQSTPTLAGVWTYNKALSQVARDVGFSMNWIPPSGGTNSGGGGTRGSGGGGRGRRGGGGGAGGGSAFPGFTREGSEESKRVQMMTAEVRTPPGRLTIIDSGALFTITNDLGQSRALHVDGKSDSVDIQGIPVGYTAKRDGDKVQVVYNVQAGRDIHYTYSHSATPPQLVVEVEFVEHNGGDKAKLVYDSGTEATTTAPPAPPAPGAPEGTAPPGSNPNPLAGETFDTRPGAELRGLKTLGVLVEDLGPTATACGLNRDTLENGLAKRLRDGGFTVRTNSDDDSYVYVNVQSTRLPDGTCASRYDVFLYTHATAKVSYAEKPVLVQVSLMHRGGIGTSAVSGHAAAVARGLENYVDLVITQIRQATQAP